MSDACDAARTVAILEPIPSLREQLAEAAVAAGYMVVTEMTVTDPVDPGIVVMYIDGAARSTARELLDRGHTLVALRDERSGASDLELISLGFRAVLPRGCADAKFVAALGGVVNGLRTQPELDLTPRQLQQIAKLAALSADHRDLLQYLAHGEGLRDTARQSGYSERTIQRNLQQIYKVLGVSGKNEALVLASAFGIVTPRA